LRSDLIEELSPVNRSLSSSSGSNYYVRILSTIDRELLKAGASVALHKHSNALVDILPPESDSSISMLQAGLTHCLIDDDEDENELNCSMTHS
jgi:ATP-dependent 26S proteasome regulatory subunit